MIGPAGKTDDVHVGRALALRRQRVDFGFEQIRLLFLEPFGFLRALWLLRTPRRQTVVIGDQVFTDVLGAKLLGLRTVLTEPIVAHDFPLTRVLRLLERVEATAVRLCHEQGIPVG